MLNMSDIKQFKKGNPTIRDIAKEANVSTATVSNAISGKRGMGANTRKRILRIVEKLRYYPNLQARGLVSQKIESIGIVIPRTSEFAFSNPFYSEVLKGIASRVRETKLHLVFSFADEKSYAEMHHSRLVSGIIVLANRIGDPKIEELKKAKVPLVLIPGEQKKEANAVSVDNIGGSCKAVNYLISLGHRRIGFLNGPMDSKFSIERLDGYCQALEENKLPFVKSLVLETDFSLESAFSCTKKLLSTSNPPTACFIVNDYCTLGAIKAIKELKMRIPQDISIVGFGDLAFASIIDSPLTTVHEPLYEVGREAVDMLLRIVQKKKVLRKNLILPTELIIRGSAEVPPKNKML